MYIPFLTFIKCTKKQGVHSSKITLIKKFTLPSSGIFNHWPNTKQQTGFADNIIDKLID